MQIDADVTLETVTPGSKTHRSVPSGYYPRPLDVHFSPSTVGLCVVVACPGDPVVAACPVIESVVDPVVIACPVIEPVVDPLVWVAVLIILHSFNVMVVFT